MKKILIFGCSGHAKVIVDMIELSGLYEIAGYICRERSIKSYGSHYPILGTDRDLDQIMQQISIHAFIIAIGENMRRMILYNAIKKVGIPHVTIIHPSSIIARDVTIGPGTVVMAGAIINPNVTIGTSCIINTNASIDHDCQIGDFSSIAPGTTIGGNVTIGNNSAVCLGSRIIPGITIGDNVLIGAGSLVLHDIPDNVIVYGSPAKIMRKNERPT
jgi:sugar O-acyltransferase (sialic acid O-acetyltransferase NeuD family)